MSFPGFAFTPRTDGANHLWIAISREVSGKALFVNLTDRKNFPDSPCVLNIGDHEWIRKESVAFYPGYKEWPIAPLNEAMGTIRIWKPASASLLSKLIAGAKMSDDIPERILNTYFLE